MSRQWDAKFSGRRIHHDTKRIDEQRSKSNITVFEYDREDAVREVFRVARQYGYIDINIDQVKRIR